MRFPCVSTGDPAPSMFWRREDSPVDYLPNPDEVSVAGVPEKFKKKNGS